VVEGRALRRGEKGNAGILWWVDGAPTPEIENDEGDESDGIHGDHLGSSSLSSLSSHVGRSEDE
jgi:hypothetical protein